MAAGTSSNKVKEISEILYQKTILPAKEEAEKIIADARDAAAGIIHDAKEQAKNNLEKNRKEMNDETKVHESSIELAVKQSIATLKSEIMTIFNKELRSGLTETLNNEEVLKELLKAIVDGINKEGIKTDLKLYVSKEVNFETLSKSVISAVQGKLEKGEVTLPSGIAVHIEDKKFTLRVAPDTLMKIVADNLSEALKEKVFA